MAKKKITQLDPATSVNSDALFPLSQEDNNEDKTFKGTIEQLGDYINKSQDYNDLNTTSKKVIGAINEVLANSDKDIISSIDTPAPIMSFNDGGDNIPVNALTVEIEASVSGITEVNVTRCGKNFFDKSTITRDKNLVWSTGKPDNNETGSWVSDFIFVKPNETYIASSTLSQVFAYDNTKTAVYVWKSSGWSAIGGTGNSLGTYFTIPEGISYIRFSRRNTEDIDTDVASFQVEKGMSRTTYEAYKGNTYTIALDETLTQGGSLEVVSGLLTRTDTTTKQLTGVSVPTISGTNNIYADCGDIQLLEYFNENADEVAELNRAMSDDFHIYSTAEQIVGKWLGDDLYEKSYHYTQATVPAQATAVVIDNAISSLNLASLVDMTCVYKTHHISQNYDNWYHGGLSNTQLDYNTGNLLFYQKATSQQQNYNNLEVNITIRYTKAS